MYLCMEHELLFGCLRTVCSQVAVLAPTRGTQTLLNVLKTMSGTPRSLKQLARLGIYKALDKKPGLLASKIGLPPVLRDYVLNFEP